MNGIVVGHIKSKKLDILTSINSIFRFVDGRIMMSDDLANFDSRSEAMQHIADKLLAVGEIRSLYGERCSVLPKWFGSNLMEVDRSLLSWFGFPSIGVHLNGIVQDEKNKHMWLSHRSPHLFSFPNKLDNLVAGGHGVSTNLQETLYQECHEEALISRDLASKSILTSLITFCVDHGNKLRRGAVFCYDLNLPRDWIPKNEDGEASQFELLEINEVLKVVSNATSFKFNSALVIIDYMIRNGHIDPSEEDFIGIVSGLRKSSSELLWK